MTDKQGDPIRVLVLESDLNQRALIREALDQTGHEVVFAENVNQVLTLVESGKFRFVLLANNSYDNQNSDLVRRIHSLEQSAVFVLELDSTGTVSSETDDLLRKPFTKPDLVARLQVGQRVLTLTDDLATARERLDKLGLYDGITGLMNRNAFYRTAYGELERARRAPLPFSLIALDLDDFKVINSTYGSETGDEVLKMVAKTIREKSRPYDCIGRWIGDEFALALSGVIGEDAEKICERIIAGVHSTEIPSKTHTITVGMSAGIAAVLRIGASMEVEPLLEQARLALARAKESGGNTVNLTYV